MKKQSKEKKKAWKKPEILVLDINLGTEESKKDFFADDAGFYGEKS